MPVFAQKKMCAFQRSSEHLFVVIRRVARLSRIGAQLMFEPSGHVLHQSRVGWPNGSHARAAAEELVRRGV